jgi:tRNA G18 (ribose-2'-O)-methylase SpoU
VAEGEKVVLRLLMSPVRVVSLLTTEEWWNRLADRELRALPRPADIFLGPLPLLRTIVGFNLHQGIMAVGEVPAEPPPDALPMPHLLVALDGLVLSENVGVIVRNCGAFGADGVIAGETSGSPYLRRAVRNSMGAVFHLRIFHPPVLREFLESLKSAFGTRIIAADASGDTLLQETDFQGNVCLVAGNEDQGIAPAIREVCDVRVRIPMSGVTDSLNVSNAVAVFLYQATMRRRGWGQVER